MRSYFRDEEGNLFIKKDGKLVQVDHPKRQFKQVNSAKLERIMENEEYEIVLVKRGGSYIRRSVSTDKKVLFSKKPMLRASFDVPYDNLVVAVLHNEFLYTTRKEAGIMYVDREDAAWWWYKDRIVLLPTLFWTQPELRVFEFNKEKEKKSET